MKKAISLLFVLSFIIPFCMAQNETPLYGKSMVIIGDSYVKNHRRPVTETWHYKIAQKYHMTYHNYGRNGNCIAFDRTKEGFGIPMYLRYKDMTDTADYVMVVAGHNDATMISRYDTIGHEALDTFKSRMRELTKGLIEKYPHAKIAFFTPWNIDQKEFHAVISAMEEICAEYHISIYNAAQKSGIDVRDESFRKKYFQSPNDTAHLNDAGHSLFMDKAESFLLGL